MNVTLKVDNSLENLEGVTSRKSNIHRETSLLVTSSRDLYSEPRLCRSPSDHLWVLIPDVFMVVVSEVVVDIIKHAFITKFNDITADVRTIR